MAGKQPAPKKNGMPKMPKMPKGMPMKEHMMPDGSMMPGRMGSKPKKRE